MADTYLGIGKLNFFVFLVVYFMIVGVVGALFDPIGNGLVPTEESLSSGAGKWNVDVEKGSDSNILGDPPGLSFWDTLTTIAKTIGTVFNIFWIGLTFNIPGMPILLRMFMVIPVVLVFIIVLFDIIIDLLNAVFKVPLAG
jgi:hypothetical protein